MGFEFNSEVALDAMSIRWARSGVAGANGQRIFLACSDPTRKQHTTSKLFCAFVAAVELAGGDLAPLAAGAARYVDDSDRRIPLAMTGAIWARAGVAVSGGKRVFLDCADGPAKSHTTKTALLAFFGAVAAGGGDVAPLHQALLGGAVTPVAVSWVPETAAVRVPAATPAPTAPTPAPKPAGATAKVTVSAAPQVPAAQAARSAQSAPKPAVTHAKVTGPARPKVPVGQATRPNPLAGYTPPDKPGAIIPFVEPTAMIPLSDVGRKWALDGVVISQAAGRPARTERLKLTDRADCFDSTYASGKQITDFVLSVAFWGGDAAPLRASLASGDATKCGPVFVGVR